MNKRKNWTNSGKTMPCSEEQERYRHLADEAPAHRTQAQDAAGRQPEQQAIDGNAIGA